MTRKNTTRPHPQFHSAKSAGWLLLLVYWLLAVQGGAQTLKKEYIYINGKLVAIEIPAGETVPPVVQIQQPTTDPGFSTNSQPINLSGTASDNIAVTQVSWSNSRGGNGSCSGTTSWSCASLPLESGQNILTITARDAAGNLGTDILTVTYSPQDTQAPTISITSPTANPTYTTTSSSITLGGSASDNVAVTQVSWANSMGGGASCSGTGSWTCGSIVLQNGVNVLTVTARDAANNAAIDTLTVTYSPADTQAPTVTIQTPTTAPEYSTNSNPINLAGIASDNVAVTEVRWTNSRGASGTCSGTESWTCYNIPLQNDDNVLTITARDAAYNTATDTLIVTYSISDTEAPTVTITAPTVNSNFNAFVTPITLGGLADDNVAVTQVHWANNRGGNGTCTGTTAWTCGGVTLLTGQNVLTVTASDAAQNNGVGTLTVNYQPAWEIPAPQLTSATAITGNQVQLIFTIGPYIAPAFQIQRMPDNHEWWIWGSYGQFIAYDNTTVPGTTYKYRVRVMQDLNVYGPYSNWQVASTISFSDDPLTAGSSVIESQHFQELRQAVAAVRSVAGLPAPTWTDANLQGLPVKSLHLTEIRNQLNQAFDALQIARPDYTDPIIVPGVTVIKAAHIQEIRQAIK
jgi:hypothetical protein